MIKEVIFSIFANYFHVDKQSKVNIGNQPSVSWQLEKDGGKAETSQLDSNDLLMIGSNLQTKCNLCFPILIPSCALPPYFVHIYPQHISYLPTHT